ncbi:hypothetical protein, partial [Rhizobium mongolense]|uniref:hypothetical protein n=1 Tax=Rhizobium mongolense TaxID=57676 RepID=UPI001ABFECCF
SPIFLVLPSPNFAGSGISGGVWSGPLTQPASKDAITKYAALRASAVRPLNPPTSLVLPKVR